MFLPIVPQSRVRATNGHYHWIQRAQKVRKYPSAEVSIVVVMVFEGMKFVRAEFFPGGLWSVFARSATSMSVVNKLRLPLDSAPRKGPETPFYRVFNCSGDVSRGSEVC